MRTFLSSAAVAFACMLAACGTPKPAAPVAPVAAAPTGRVIRAVRADTPPVLDGKLDDACWKSAQEVTGFLAYNSTAPATQQTFAYVAYDAAHLYVGIRCLLPQGVAPQGRMRPHDANVFSDDAVEIMLDPGATRRDYFQLALNAYGATFDCARRHGGVQEDDAWDGDWAARTEIGDGFWSAEIAVPFHNLGITSGVDATWGINLCRDNVSPKELSAVSSDGTFTDAAKFATLEGLNVDFSRYFIPIEPGEVLLNPATRPPQAVLTSKVTNLTGEARELRIERRRTDATAATETITLPPDGAATLALDPVALEPLFPDRSDLYLIRNPPQTKQIVVSDASTGTALASAVIRRPSLCEVIAVEVEDPWRRQPRDGWFDSKEDLVLPDDPLPRTRRLNVCVRLALSESDRKDGALFVGLLPPDGGGEVVTKRIPSPDAVVTLRLPVSRLPWGAYRVRALFAAADGSEVASATAPAMLLPGGPNSLQVLNNLVTELMNARERGLLRDGTIEFMNPRDGWCWFSVSGKCRIALDGAPLLSGEQSGAAVEAMRLLPAGRHVLTLEGAPEQVLVRAVPELIYCQYPANPHIAPHGPYDWAFLARNVLRDSNLIVGSADDTAMNLWRERGGRWLTHVLVPFMEEDHFTAQAAYEHWTKSPGYVHPLMDGMIADEFISGSEEKWLAWAESLRQLKADPKFQGRALYAWCGAVHGSEAGRVFLRSLHGCGWKHAYEAYLPEQPDEPSAKRYIRDHLVRVAAAWDAAIPGANRHAVMTLGYMSHPTESLNHYPNADFKVFMDLEYVALANAPVFFGLYGVMEYLSSYADEETVRWAAKLYRHYGIEGHRTRLSTDPYILPHLVNPDFAEGDTGWTLRPARTGTLAVKEHPGYSWLQGRYPPTSAGDRFLVMKRIQTGPNVFRQEIRNLVPGRLYSLKMISADYQDLVQEKSEQKTLGVALRIDGAELLTGPKDSFQFAFPNCYAHTLGKFDAKYPFWMNYHWQVFRATSDTANLTVSDWKSATNPGGPLNQEILCNFIEVQPYLAE